MAEGGESGDSGDDSQKTEEPTARRLDEARKRGQVIQSREVSAWVVLCVASLVFLSYGPSMMGNIKDTLRVFLERPHQMAVDAQGINRLMADLMKAISGNLVLPLLALAVAGALAGFVQVGPLLTGEPLKPKLEKISIIKGFGRLFSIRSIVEFLKGIFKLVVMSIVFYMILRPYFAGLEHFAGQDIAAGMNDMKILATKMLVASLAVLFVLAVADYMFQRHDFMKKMRMSKQEMKEEFKQTEGDPMVKGKLRQLREARARQRMMQSVPEADVVITNPTHFAVALKYDPKEMGAPVMVAKGADLIAEKIKEIARENKVPLVENAPLARALFDGMDIDQVIPEEHFKAVAEVISYVFKLKGKSV